MLSDLIVTYLAIWNSSSFIAAIIESLWFFNSKTETWEIEWSVIYVEIDWDWDWQDRQNEVSYIDVYLQLLFDKLQLLGLALGLLPFYPSHLDLSMGILDSRFDDYFMILLVYQAAPARPFVSYKL